MTRDYRFAVSACTTYHSTFDQDLRDYAATGVDGIGLWESKLPAGQDGRSLDAFLESGLTATFCFPEVPAALPGDVLFAQPRDPEARIQRMCEGITRLAAFHPVAVACYAGPPGNMPEAEARRWVIESLRRGGEAAGEAGTRLALEVLRPSPGGSLASSVAEALALIDESGSDNIDVFVDVWHAWSIDLFIDELTLYRDRILGVQVCDRPTHPRSWMDRKLPGDGDLPLVDILRTLRRNGFDGWFELEIFSDDGTFGNDYPDSLWRRPPVELLRDSLSDFEALWEEAK
jgi:sugar phosphate isomerase/epimerase